MGDLSSQTRDQTLTLKSKCTVLTTGPPGKSQKATLDWNLAEAEPEEVTSEL